MTNIRLHLVRCVTACVLILATDHCTTLAEDPIRGLVFTKTVEYRHKSIPSGLVALGALSEKHGFAIVATEDARRFTEARLAEFDVVVFLNTSGDVLDDAQQAALQSFIRAGGGFVGVHGATDTEYEWPWYGEMIGAWFNKHPKVQHACIEVTDGEHPSTRHLPERWCRTDEWYNFRSRPVGVNVLMEVDETSYEGGAMGDAHPIAWCHAFEGGRAWYTAIGHTDATYDEPLFRAHLYGGIVWASGRGAGGGGP